MRDPLKGLLGTFIFLWSGLIIGVYGQTPEDSVLVGDERKEKPIFYQARDSMRLYLGEDNTQWRVALYGNAKVNQDQLSLAAYEIEIKQDKSLYAKHRVDSLGIKQGIPQLVEGGDQYHCDAIAYNFNTRKAYVEGLVTQQDQAYVHGNKVNMMPDHTLLVLGGRYTTCNLAEPHFHIRSKKIKILPKKHIVSGLFNVYVEKIPLPVFLPFGFFPRPQDRVSGIVFPSYGEERRRGFFLRDGGYYVAISPKMDLRVVGDIYSKGSYAARANLNYLRRYRYGGRVGLRYNFTKSDAFLAGGGGKGHDYWLSWYHTPQLRRNSQFSASFEGGASAYNVNTLNGLTENLRTEFTSNIAYRHRFGKSPVSLSAALRHHQNIETLALNFTLPTVALNVNGLYPFAKKSQIDLIKRLNVSYRSELRNEVSNVLPHKAKPVALSSEDGSTIWRYAKNGVQHTIPISTSFTLAKHFVISPQFNYRELWYIKSLHYRYDESAQALRVDTLSGFSRASEYATSLSTATRIYGTFLFEKNKRIKALRHTLNPSISFQYKPDFSDPKYGIHQTIVAPNGRVYRRSKYDGFIFGTTSVGEQAAMQFALSNQLEMKVVDAKDSLGRTKKIPILQNLSMSGSYNFAIDSFQLSRIRFAARTRLFNRISVAASATLDPYVWERLSAEGQPLRQRRTAQYSWQKGQGIGRFSSMDLSMNFQWESNQKKNKKQPTKDQKRTPYKPFNPPWNISAGYNIAYRKSGWDAADVIQSIALSGGLSLTPKTRIQFSSGYDISQKRITQTYVNFIRDLHCWEIVGGWIPFGRFTSYQVTFRAKSSLLRDLKVAKQRSFLDAFQ